MCVPAVKHWDSWPLLGSLEDGFLQVNRNDPQTLPWFLPRKSRSRDESAGGKYGEFSPQQVILQNLREPQEWGEQVRTPFS